MTTEGNVAELSTLVFSVVQLCFNEREDLDSLDAGDFCLIDRIVVDAVKRHPDSGRFLRGLWF